MKSGSIHSKTYNKLFWLTFCLLIIVGWYFGGFWIALLCAILAVIIDIYIPLWQSELTWSDIDNALRNIYKYGNSPCELCFRVDKRFVYVYRDERGSKTIPIRMAVRIPLKDWDDLFNEEDYQNLFKKVGGVFQYSNNRGPSLLIYSSIGNHIEDCKEILKILFSEAVGGLRPNIFAKSKVAAKKNIWMVYDKEGIKTDYNRA